MSNKIIDPEKVYSKLTDRVANLKSIYESKKEELISLKATYQELKDSVIKAEAEWKSASNIVGDVTKLVEVANTAWDAELKKRDEIDNQRAQANFNAVQEAKEDYYQKGYKDRETEIKSEYKLTKKKVSKPKKQKPAPIAESIIKERAKRKLKGK